MTDLTEGFATYVLAAEPDTAHSGKSVLKVEKDQSAALVFHSLDGLPASLTLTSAYLVFTRQDAVSVTPTFLLQALDGFWGASRTTWNDRPGLTGTTTTLTQASSTALDTFSFNVLTQVTAALSTGAFGFELDRTDSGAAMQFYGFNTDHPPTLTLTYTTVPAAPTNLRPSGGRALATDKPTLRWDGGDIIAVQVQIDATAGTFSSPQFDSGTVVSTEPELNLAATAYGGITAAVDKSWRARHKNSSGVWSDWSDVAHMTYRAHFTLSITFPDDSSGGIVNTNTPTITWSQLGTQKSYRVRIVFADDKSRALFDTGEVASTTKSVTLPDMVIRDSSDLLLRLETNDQYDREDVPGFPIESFVETTFSFQGTGAVNPPDTLTVSQIGTSPFLDIAWQRTHRPDSWQIRMDGQIVVGQSDTADLVEHDDGLYHYTYYGASGGEIHHFRVAAKVGNQVSAGGPTVDTLTFPEGIWLGNPNTADAVLLWGEDVGTWDMGEVSAAYRPLRGDSVIRVTQSIGGYEDDLTGYLIDDPSGNSSRFAYRALLTMRDNPAPAKNYVVAFPYVAFEALLSHIVPRPGSDGTNRERWDVTLHVEQQGDLLWIGREPIDTQTQLLYTIDFEEGTDGAAVTTGTNPLFSVTSGAPLYEADDAVHGVMGMRIPAASGGGMAECLVPYIGMASVYFTPRASTGGGALVRMDPAGLGNSFFINLRSGGDLDISDGSNTLVKKSNGVYGWTLNKTARVDFQWTWDPAALECHVACRLFTVAESSTPSDEWDGVFACPDAPARLGIGNNTASKSTGYDSVRVYAGNSTWPDPVLPGVEPSVAWSIPGALTTVGAQITSRVFDTDTIQLAVSTSLSGGDPASPTYLDPDGDSEGTLVSPEGIVKHTVGTGAANTTYYAKLSTSPGVFIGDLIQWKTLPALGAALTRKVAVVSCQRNADGSETQIAWTDILAWGPDDIWMIGDSHYQGGKFTAASTWQDHLETYTDQLTGLPAMKQAWARASMANLADDHEISNDNGDSKDNPVRVQSITAMQQIFSNFEYGDSREPASKRGLYGSMMYGQHIRVLFTDSMSLDRSLAADTDNASKTFFGAEQDAWLRDQLVKPAAINIIVCPKSLLGDAEHDASSADKWSNYTSARTALANWIADNVTLDGQPIQVGWMGGDRHANGYLSGASNDIIPGAPVWLSSGAEMHALDRQSGEDWDDDFGYYDHTANRPVVQWMKFTLTDTLGGGGTGTIDIDIQSRQSEDTWDGSAETDPATWTITDGFSASDSFAYEAAPGFVVSPWAGDATQDTIEISVLTTACTSVGLKVSANADMSAATSYTAAAPTAEGFVKWSVTGLATGQPVYYRFTDTPTGKPTSDIGDIYSAMTLHAENADCVVKIAAGSCQQGAPMSQNVWLDMLDWGPTRVMHLGDFGYPNYLSTGQSTHRNNWARQLVNPIQAQVMGTAAMDYVISDHDVNGSNDVWPKGNGANKDDAISATNLLAWAAVVPARMDDVRSPKRARYRSEVEGRVRFCKVDTRSQDRDDDRQNGVVPADNPSMLGSTQKTWLKAEIAAAAAAGQLVVIWTDPAWNGSVADVIDSKGAGTGVPISYSDKWPAYELERDEISDYAATVGAQLFIAHGDSHGMQQDDGTNEKNGFAVVCCGPFDQQLHMHFQDSYQWSYPAGIEEGGHNYRSAQQYQRLTVTTSGNTVTVIADAMDCTTGFGSSTPVRTMTKVYNFGGSGVLQALNPGDQTGTIGDALDLQLFATGGTQPYAWSAFTGPTGASMDANGHITGTLTTAQVVTCSATVTDADSATSTVTWQWTVNATVGALTVNNPGDQSGNVGDVVSKKITASGGVTPYTWAITGQPPATHIGSKGKISGTLTTAGDYSATITVTDSLGATASTTFAYHVDNGAVYVPPAGSILPDTTNQQDMHDNSGVNTHANFTSYQS